ncbi:MAG: phenylalanine--tRNA ligase subunit beta [archaeon]
MVVLDTSYKQLVKLLGRKISLDKLKDTLFDMGLELEHSGDALRVEVTPDRPDLISTYGLARALRSYLKIKSLPHYRVKKSSVKVLVKPSVKDVRPFTVAAVIKNLKFDDEKIKEVIWVQEKLHATFARNRKKAAIGVYPMEHIVPPITYSAEDPDSIKFVPLEEKREMTGKQILSGTSTGRQYASLLEGYSKFPFFTDKNNEVLSMPPIINSNRLGKVSKDTKEVFIECSGHDFKALETVLNILVCVFADMGGDIYSVDVVYGKKVITTPDLTPEKRQITALYVNSVLGTKLSANQIRPLLSRMMYDVIGVVKDTVKFSVPAFRSDIWHDVDVADDVGRAFGFSNIVPEHGETATVGGTTMNVKVQEDVGDLMVALGFQQSITLALTSADDQFVKMNLDEFNHIKLGSVADKSLNMVRVWLVPELMKCLVSNRNREYPQKFFETGFVVKPDDKSDVKSRNILRFAAVTAHKSANYTEIKQAMEYVLDNMDIDYSIEDVEHSSFIPGRVGRVAVNGKKVGFIGEIHPQVLINLGLEVPVSAVEINFTDIFES